MTSTPSALALVRWAWPRSTASDSAFRHRATRTSMPSTSWRRAKSTPGWTPLRDALSNACSSDRSCSRSASSSSGWSSLASPTKWTQCRSVSSTCSWWSYWLLTAKITHRSLFLPNAHLDVRGFGGIICAMKWTLTSHLRSVDCPLT